MKIIISADGRKLCASTGGQPLTSGSVGIEAAFVLSADYDGLAVTAVFRAGEVSVDVLLTGPSCTVPWEVLETSGYVLIVGVVGKNGSGEIVIPTIWGRVGMVECGTVAEGIDPQDPTPDIAAQLLQIAQETVARAETAETAATEAAAAAGESATAAGEAKTDAETAAQDAEAARQAIEDLSVEAHEDPDGPSVEKTVDPETGAVTLDFGIPPAPEVPVQSVNGKTGAVQLTLDDIPDGESYVRTTPAQVQQIGINAADIERLKTDVAKKYEKPATGIPASDMAQAVQDALTAAGTALQPAALQPYRTASDQDVIDDAQNDRLDDLEQTTTAATIGHAPIVTFDASAADMPLKQVVVNIEPVQDLHGQASPYPAGGGVNKLPPTIAEVKTGGGLTCTSDGNGVFTFTGTYSSTFDQTFSDIELAYTVRSGDYLHCCNSSAATSAVLILNFTDRTGISATLSPINKIQSMSNYAGKTVKSIRLYSAAQFSGTVSPMIVASSEFTPFSPYSNICPISGWTGCNVTRTGKNLLNENVMIAGTNFDDNGVIIMNSSYRTLQEYIPVTPSTTYSLQMTKNIYGTRGFNVCFYDADKQFISRNNYILSSSAGLLTGTFTTTADTSFIRCGAPVSTDASNLMIEAGSIATDFEPFGNTYPITFPTEAGTVYGGTLDVTGGKMVVDMAIVDLGTLTWTASTTSEAGKNRFIADVPGFAVGTTAYAICSEYKRISSTYDYGVTGFSPHGALACILVADITRAEMTGAEFKTAMSGVQLCYELAAPVEIPLTPTEITTLLGTNNIWADCGDVTVTYGAYLETLKASLDRTNGDLDTLRACIAPIEDRATASQAYAAGAYFFRNGIFCTALIPIQSGGQFTIGTNYQTTTVAAALIALQS